MVIMVWMEVLSDTYTCLESESLWLGFRIDI